MKKNLVYFTILYPSMKKIKSKAYLFNTDSKSIVFELEISENALIEFQLFDIQKYLI